MSRHVSRKILHSCLFGKNTLDTDPGHRVLAGKSSVSRDALDTDLDTVHFRWKVKSPKKRVLVTVHNLVIWHSLDTVWTHVWTQRFRTCVQGRLFFSYYFNKNSGHRPWTQIIVGRKSKCPGSVSLVCVQGHVSRVCVQRGSEKTFLICFWPVHFRWKVALLS